jgi:hypothetical protein
MENLRTIEIADPFAEVRCCRCDRAEGRWDRIALRPYCPNCEESLALGVGEPLIERAERRQCAICARVGTLAFQTIPLHSDEAVEMDLCANHFRDLLARRLGPHAFHQLRRRLSNVGLSVGQIFLLHEAFYDVEGRALQPALIED